MKATSTLIISTVFFSLFFLFSQHVSAQGTKSGMKSNSLNPTNSTEKVTKQLQPTDLINPISVKLNCLDDIMQVADPGLCGAIVEYPMPTYEGGVLTIVGQMSGTFFSVGETYVFFVVTGDNGNQISCPMLVTILDIYSPTIITYPPMISANTNPGENYATNPGITAPVATDECGVAGLVATNNAPTEFPIGTTTVIWTIHDAAGNSVSCSQLVTVSDLEPPLVQAPANKTVSADQGLSSASNVDLGTPVATDNDIVSSILNDAAAAFVLGNTAITWTATDASGNTSTATQIVTVVDLEPPVIIAAANLTLQTEAGNCSNSSASIGLPLANDNDFIASVSSDRPEAFPLGTTTVTWTATDASGNTSTATQLVTIIDSQAPTLVSAPSTITATTNHGFSYSTGISLTPPEFSDDCSVNITLTNNAPVQYALGNTTITWTATDEAGNISTTNQLVIVNDNEPPILTCSSNMTSELCNNVVNYTITASDNSSNPVTIVSNPPSGSTFPVGSTTVTSVATDLAGNSSSCSFTVTILPNSGAIASYNTGLCTGTTLSLFASGGVTYAWSGPGCFHSNVQNPTRCSTTSAMAGNYTVTVTNSNGCTSSAAVNVVLNPLPGTPTSISGTASILRGGTYTYITTISNASSYIWSYTGTGATITGTGNTVKIAFSSTATNGILKVKGQNSCGFGAIASVNITTTPGSCIHVYSSKHHVGEGCHPTTVKSPCAPINSSGTQCGFKVYKSHDIGYTAKRNCFSNIYHGSNSGGSSGSSYNPGSDVTSCVNITGPELSNCGGSPSYKYDIVVPAGKRYLVVGEYAGGENQNGSTQSNVCSGKRTYNKNNHSGYCDDDDDGDDDGDDDPAFQAGCSKDMYIQIIEDAYGKVRPANTDCIPGSLLLITAPNYIEFTDSIELLPIVYESVEGAWEVGVTATPPEGFYSVQDSLQAQLNTSNLSVLQFSLVDTGSVWTATTVNTTLKHNNKDIRHTVNPSMIDHKVKKDYLSQNFPNPFSGETTIPYLLPNDSKVKLSVYDIYGRELVVLVNKEQKKGSYSETWKACTSSGCNLTSGAYLVRLQVTSTENGNTTINNKTMVYIK